MNAQLSFPTHMCEKVKAHSTAMSLHWNTTARRHIYCLRDEAMIIGKINKTAP